MRKSRQQAYEEHAEVLKRYVMSLRTLVVESRYDAIRRAELHEQAAGIAECDLDGWRDADYERYIATFIAEAECVIADVPDFVYITPLRIACEELKIIVDAIQVCNDDSRQREC